ncbi:hypothetical protein ACFX1X_009200 [Malus domestica]
MDVSARVLLRLSPHASLYPSHLPYLFLKQMRNLPWKHKMLKMSTREQCQVKTRPKEKTGKSMIWDTLAFNPDDMRYSCSSIACLQRYYRGGKKAEYFERLRWECPLRYDEGLSIFAGPPVRWGWRSTYIGVSLTTSSTLLGHSTVVGAASFTCFNSVRAL